MKTKFLKISVALMVTLAVIASPALYAKSIDTAVLKKALAEATPVELPAKAASLISAAGDKEKSEYTKLVVRMAVSQNPAAAPAIVGAIAHDVPTMAPLAAVTAASAQHKQLALIAQSAAAAAPAQAGQIVAALIKEFPSRYSLIAMAVSKGAPAASREILAAVGDSVPALQASIQANVAVYGANNTAALPVDAILSQSPAQVPSTPAAPVVNTTRPVQGPPIIGPPFTPIPPSPPEINNTANNPEQPGGRNYASP